MKFLVFCSFSDRVAVGRALDLPVYFGDAGSREVKIAYERPSSRLSFSLHLLLLVLSLFHICQ